MYVNCLLMKKLRGVEADRSEEKGWQEGFPRETS